MRNKAINVGRGGLLLSGIVLGVGLAHLFPPARAEMREREEHRPVPSGAFQAARQLEAIQATLASIDRRLERMESHAETIARRAAEE